VVKILMMLVPWKTPGVDGPSDEIRKENSHVAVIASIIRPAGSALTAFLLAGFWSISAHASDELTGDFELRGDTAAGEAIYLRHCASCHGPKGAGDGQEGRAFEGGPSDLTTGEADAERLYRATRDGGMAVGLSGAMPVFRHTLDEEEIHDVVAYLIQLAQ